MRFIHKLAGVGISVAVFTAASALTHALPLSLAGHLEPATEPALVAEPPVSPPPLVHAEVITPGLAVAEGLARLERFDDPYTVLCGRPRKGDSRQAEPEVVDKAFCEQALQMIKKQFSDYIQKKSGRLFKSTMFYQLKTEGGRTGLIKKGKEKKVSLRGNNVLVGYVVPVDTQALREELEISANDIHAYSKSTLLCVPPDSEVMCDEQAERPDVTDKEAQAQVDLILGIYSCPPATVYDFTQSVYARGADQCVVFGIPYMHGKRFLINLLDSAEGVLLGVSDMSMFMSERAFNIELIGIARALQLANVFNSSNALISRLFLNMMRLAKGLAPFAMHLMPNLIEHTPEESLNIYKQNLSEAYDDK